MTTGRIRTAAAWGVITALAPIVAACAADPSAVDVADAPRAQGDADAAPAIGPTGERDVTIEVDGAPRTYVIDVPPRAADAMRSAPVPLVVTLHGAGDDARAFLGVTGLRAVAEAKGFVVIAPRAPDGFAGDGAPARVRADVDFVLSTVRDVRAAYAVDPRRIFLTGFSRGAGFAGLIATASRTDDPVAASLGVPPFESPFAAYALSAGYDMFVGKVDLARADPKRAVWLIHAASDGTVPFRAGASFASALRAAGWRDVTLTTVDAPPSMPPHDWLWQPAFGHSAEELWSWLSSRAPP